MVTDDRHAALRVDLHTRLEKKAYKTNIDGQQINLMGVDAEDAPAAAHDVAEAAGVWHRVRGEGEGGVHPVPV